MTSSKFQVPSSKRLGFSLIELVVAIAVVSVSMVAMSATILSFRLRQVSNYKSLAYALAEEELSSIKTIPFAQLTNVASSTFSNVLYNLGKFAVSVDGASSTPPNIYAVTATGTAVNTITNLRVLPSNSAAIVSFNLKLRYPINPPTNWATGILFRASDYKNYYRLVIKGTGLELAKSVNGTITVLSTYAFTPTVNTWYAIGVSANGSSITPYVNGINTGTTTDSSQFRGAVAIIGQNGLMPLFDDISLSTDNTATSTWNFDKDTVGNDATAFKKLGVYDLPLGRDELTIENYLGQNDFKKITVSVYWTDRGIKKGISLSTLRNN